MSAVGSGRRVTLRCIAGAGRCGAPRPRQPPLPAPRVARPFPSPVAVAAGGRPRSPWGPPPAGARRRLLPALPRGGRGNRVPPCPPRLLPAVCGSCEGERCAAHRLGWAAGGRSGPAFWHCERWDGLEGLLSPSC